MWKLAWNEYFKNNGVAKDYKGEPDTWGSRPSTYLEGDDPNNTVTFPGGMTVFEPCNAASNLAFYKGVVRMCRNPNEWNLSDEYLIEIKRIISQIAMGSTLMHGGHTHLGGIMDGKNISILAYLLHSALVGALGITNPKIRDMTFEARDISALELSQNLTSLYATEPNTVEWGKYLEN